VTVWTYLSVDAALPAFKAWLYAKNEKGRSDGGEEREFAASIKEIVTQWQRK
jgi:hypothetical protein